MPRFRRWIFGLREALSTAFWVGRGVAAIEERALVGMTRQTWATSNGKRQTANGKRQTANGKPQTANGKRQTANGKRQTANGKRQTAMAFEAGPSLRFGMTTKI